VNFLLSVQKLEKVFKMHLVI